MMDAILRRRDGLFDVFVKNDGVDYWRLAKACIEANVDQAGLLRDSAAPRTWTLDCGGVRGELTALAWGNPKRLVLRLDAGGRRYVVKRAFMRSPGFKRVLPGVIGLTYFTSVMKQVNAAVRAGCDATQDYYLVAERWTGPFRQEVWAMMEYLEGGLLLFEKGDVPHREALRRAVVRLLDHGLTMDDMTLGNFLLCPDGAVRAIDISCRPCVRLQKMKMAAKLNLRYRLDIPVSGLANRLLYRVLDWRYRLRGDAR